MSDDVAARLREAGLSPHEAVRKAEMVDAARSALGALADAGRQPGAALHTFWVPGRIEFLGKHTDYAGGRSLLCTVERGVCVVATARTDARVRVHDVATGELVETAFDVTGNLALGHWAAYPSTVVRRLARNFGEPPLAGADIAFVSDLPPAAGMSSSSALVVATFLALSAVNDLPGRENYRRCIRTSEDLAGYAGCIEGGFDFHELAGDQGVGTLSGSEDQTAMVCSRAGKLVQYAFCPVRFERTVPLPDGYTFGIASSGVVAAKTADAMPRYNALARKARAIADVWRRSRGGAGGDATIGEILGARPAAATEMPPLLAAATRDEFTGEELVARFEHFYHESAVLIPAVADVLQRGDVAGLGPLVDRSVSLGAQLLGNQTAETLALARTAREMGAAAASPFGAGWGGSVWALVRESDAGAFLKSWRASYVGSFPARAAGSEFFMTRAGPPAMELD